jgi:hypothetical protein
MGFLEKNHGHNPGVPFFHRCHRSGPLFFHILLILILSVLWASSHDPWHPLAPGHEVTMSSSLAELCLILGRDQGMNWNWTCAKMTWNWDWTGFNRLIKACPWNLGEPPKRRFEQGNMWLSWGVPDFQTKLFLLGFSQVGCDSPHRPHFFPKFSVFHVR